MAKNAWMPRGFSLGYEKKRIKCLHSFVEVIMHVNCNWWYICHPLENPCHVSGQYTRRRRYIHVDRFIQYLVLSKFHSLLYQMMLLSTWLGYVIAYWYCWKPSTHNYPCPLTWELRGPHLSMLQAMAAPGINMTKTGDQKKPPSAS